MNNEIKIFDFHSNEVRVIQDENGEPWFVAKDVCKVLGISKNRDALSRLEEDERGSVLVDTLGGTQKFGSVNESGLYSLIFVSRKPEAKKFKKWVTKDVLPSIRQHGAYVTSMKTEEMLNNPDVMIDLLTTLKAERKKREMAEIRTQLQQKVIEDSKPKVEFYEEVMQSDDTFGVNVIAKELGYSGITLNRKLNQLGVIYKQGESWLLYSQYQDRGYTKTKTYTFVGSDGKMKSSIQTVWTQKGREFIHKKIKTM